MHYFPIILTCARSFLTNKDESFDDDLTCQLSEIIKANSLVKKFLSSEDHIALLFASTLITIMKKKSRHSASGHVYGGISNILRRKGGHIKKKIIIMRKKGKSGGKNCVRRRRLFED